MVSIRGAFPYNFNVLSSINSRIFPRRAMHDLTIGHGSCARIQPSLMEEGYSTNGWLGMLLGVRLWYGFYGLVLESDEAFEAKVSELCRELGDRGMACT